MTTKNCIICGKSKTVGRRYCNECYLSRKREQYKIRGRYSYGKSNCIICNVEITLWRKDQKYCKICCKTSTTSNFGSIANNYENGGGDGYCWMHRRIAEGLLERKLQTNEVVHHIDENPKNNELNNLIVLTRSSHSRLHWFLRLQKDILKTTAETEFIWDEIRQSLTVAWIETSNIKTINLWEVKSGPEKLLSIKEKIENIKIFDFKLKQKNKIEKLPKPKIVKPKVIKISKCPVCEENFVVKRPEDKFCSQVCSHKSLMKFNISKEELESLVWKMPTVKVAKLFSVSDKAIEKRCKSLGVTKPPRGYWAKVMSTQIPKLE